MKARYRMRASRLYRLLRAPLPLVHNRDEHPLPYLGGTKLWIGGAGAPMPLGFLNIDVVDFPGVSVAADIHALPFGDNSVSAIECDAVLEHVVNPIAAVAEMVRVLQPGGLLHVVVPFHQPFHGYPSDYQRWTREGLRRLLTDAQCEVVAEGIRTGPTATMLTYFCEYCRLLAPAKLGKAAYAAANWLVWPFRYLDLWLMRKPNAHVLANSLYIMVRKSQ